MGRFVPKPVKEHLDALFLQVLGYLKFVKYNQLSTDAKSGLRSVPFTVLRKTLGMEESQPEEPGPLRDYLLHESLHALWWAGGIGDQPHITLAEWETCRAAYLAYEHEFLPKLVEIDNFRMEGRK